MTIAQSNAWLCVCQGTMALDEQERLIYTRLTRILIISGTFIS